MTQTQKQADCDHVGAMELVDGSFGCPGCGAVIEVKVKDCGPARPLYTSAQVDRWAVEFFHLITHGDEDHREWLRGMFEHFWDVEIPKAKQTLR